MLMTILGRLAIFASLFLGYLAFSQSQKIESLSVELNLMHYTAARLKEQLADAERAEKDAERTRQEYYDKVRGLVADEPDERDGAVAPALSDAIRRLP